MNKIKHVLKDRQAPALNIYFTAGFPEKNATIPIIRSLSRHGVDLIEIGMPYSDPMADGPTIQQSSAQALKQGMTMKVLFEQVEKVSKEIDTPLILMGYLNQMMQYGEERFLQKCQETGISGLIIPDLPPELYREQYQHFFAQYNIEIIFLITPQTSDKRILMIDKLSDSFIYVVSDSSITGKTKSISDEQQAYFHRIKKMNLKNPTLIGFGISDHKSFTQAAANSAGAIIGSAFIKRLEAEYETKEVDLIIRDFVNEIRNA